MDITVADVPEEPKDYAALAADYRTSYRNTMERVGGVLRATPDTLLQRTSSAMGNAAKR